MNNLTAKELAPKIGVKPSTIVRYCKRSDLTNTDGSRIGVNDPLPPVVVKKYLPLNGSTPAKPQPAAPKKVSARVQQIRKEAEKEPLGWAYWLAILPLPMLGLVASYGVYSFAAHFVGPWIAGAEAVAFELVYISLAAVKGLDQDQAKRAKGVSVGALVVSSLYGSLAALFHRQPVILDQIDLWLDSALAILHGVPIPVLAYFVAGLLIHKK